MSETKCTACNGCGETYTQGGYEDTEPPTKKCQECDGSGDGEVQEWKESVWRDTIKRTNAMLAGTAK